MLANGRVSRHPATTSTAAVTSPPLPPATAPRHGSRPRPNAEPEPGQTQTEAGLQPKRLFASQSQSDAESRGVSGAALDGGDVFNSQVSGGGGCVAEPWQEARRRWGLVSGASDLEPDPASDPEVVADSRRPSAAQPEPDEIIDLLTPPSQGDGDSQAAHGSQQPIVIYSQDTVDEPLTPPEAGARPGNVFAPGMRCRPTTRKLAVPVDDVRADAAGPAGAEHGVMHSPNRSDIAWQATVRSGECRDSTGVQNTVGSNTARTPSSHTDIAKVAGFRQNNISPWSDLVVVLTPSTGAGSIQLAASARRVGTETSPRHHERLTLPKSADPFVDLTQGDDP